MCPDRLQQIEERLVPQAHLFHFVRDRELHYRSLDVLVLVLVLEPRMLVIAQILPEEVRLKEEARAAGDVQLDLPRVP